MANNEIDYDIIQRQLAILMTNSVAYSSKLYDMFVSTTPMDIEFNVWTSVDHFETITVPNRAKGNIPASYGSGSPEGVVEANYGTMYLDQDDGAVYIKTTLTGNTGWLRIMTEDDLEDHNRNKTSHDGTLAKIDGAYANGIYNTFKVADPVEDLDAVNKGSLDKLLGGLDNLTTESKTDIVGAINEAREASLLDAGCAVDGLSNTYTNYSALLSVILNENSEFVLSLNTPCVLTASDGQKFTITERDELNLINSGVLYNRLYQVYYDLEINELTGKHRGLTIVEGTYRKQARKPFVLAEGDGWFNTSSVPYKFILIERNEDGELIEVEKQYVFLGELEQEPDEV